MTPNADTETLIRRDERHRLADLLEKDGSVLTAYTKDDSGTLGLIIYLLRLDLGPPPNEQLGDTQ
jgi:hypothetical protein